MTIVAQVMHKPVFSARPASFISLSLIGLIPLVESSLVVWLSFIANRLLYNYIISDDNLVSIDC